jgi:uncharacterized protein
MRLIPKDQKFFSYFEELVDKIEEGAKVFFEILEDFDNCKPRIAELKQIEHEADLITHFTYERMHTTFLTPLDREDIYALVNKMDSILDMMESAAVRMSVYKIKKPALEIMLQVKILLRAIARIKRMVHGLRDIKNPQEILEGCVEINTLENEGDAVMRAAMVELFEREKDFFELIKLKEILERMEEAIDICEDVSNVVEGIVLKHG